MSDLKFYNLDKEELLQLQNLLNKMDLQGLNFKNSKVITAFELKKEIAEELESKGDE